MKLYILTEHNIDEGNQALGVFSTPEKAVAYIAEWNRVDPSEVKGGTPAGGDDWFTCGYEDYSVGAVYVDNERPQ